MNDQQPSAEPEAKSGVNFHPSPVTLPANGSSIPSSNQPPPTSQAIQGFRRWSAEEDRLLGTAPDEEIARQLGRTRVAVTARRCALRIASANARGPMLSPEQQAEAAAPDPAVMQELKSIEVPREHLSPEDEERLKLLYGPYYPPRTRRGAFLVCEWRGTVKVGGYSDAPIPWPYAFRTGYRSLILCGDLVRAVKLESEQAVAYHWEVSPTTVVKWRNTLGVEQFNAGTMRLVWRSIDLARTPEARGKIAQAARGRVLSPEHRARLIAVNRLPKSEQFKKLMSDKMRERFSSGKGLRRWTGDEEALLGTMPDPELARRLGRSVGAVAERRFLKRQGDPSTAFPWSAEQDRLLQTVTVEEASQALGRSRRAIQARRRILGLLRARPSRMFWTAEKDAILRAHSGPEAARQLSRSTSVVERRRRELGLTRPRPLSKPWTPEQIKLLGTKPDRMLARRFKRPTAAVQQKRKSLGLPLCPVNHLWRPADDNLLGKYSDADVARLLKTSVQAVVMRRSKLRISIKDSRVRPWTVEEERLLGTAPDKEVARKLGRSILAVRCKRAKTGRRYAASKIKPWTAAEDSGVRP